MTTSIVDALYASLASSLRIIHAVNSIDTLSDFDVWLKAQNQSMSVSLITDHPDDWKEYTLSVEAIKAGNVVSALRALVTYH